MRDVAGGLGDSERIGLLRALDPRRRIGTRLVLVLLPFALVPALLYLVAVNRLQARTERQMASVLLEEELARAAYRLGRYADRRAGELGGELGQVRTVLSEAGRAATEALERGPAEALPGEALEDDPGFPWYSRSAGESAVLVSRASPLAGPRLADVAATRRLEARFSDLRAGIPSLTALYVHTRSGVLRAVPGRDAREFLARGGLSPAFEFRDRWALSRAELRRRPLDELVVVTPVYPDFYGGRGSIVTAIVPVVSRSGELLGAVGADWAVEELFGRGADAESGADRELLFLPDGGVVQALGGARRPPLGESDVKALSAFRPPPGGTRDGALDLAGGPTFISVRRAFASGFTYVALHSRARVVDAVSRRVTPIVDESLRTRLHLERLFLIGLAVFSVALAFALRHALAPLRRLAQFATALSAGVPAGTLPGAERRDEIGRLSSALGNLSERMQKRTRSMEGLHDLARTASAMTRADETFARLSRRIAELVGAEKSWFCLWNPESRTLDLTPPGYGVDDERLRGVRIGLAEHSLAMLAFRTGETHVSNELDTDPKVSKPLQQQVGARRNAVFAPLRTEAGLLGVLVICDKEGTFDEEDRAAIDSYSDQAALLLRNARLYDELQKSYETLRETYRNRDHFLQNINHELRTPLTAILGWSEVLAEDQPDAATAAQAVEQIRRSAQFLLALISDLLDLARLEEGGTRLERSSVDLGLLVRDAIEPVAVMAEAKGIVMTVEAPPPGAASGTLDPVRMKQVLWNLVHNAVKFTHRGGRIDIAVSSDARGARFVVRDDGVGVDAKDLPYIFERFRQGAGSTSRAYRGTGIGLSLAKAFVDLHGGTISVESLPGRGAAFEVFIPATPSGALRKVSATSGAPRPPEAA